MEVVQLTRSGISSLDRSDLGSADAGSGYEANICGFEHSLLAAFDARTADLLRIALHVYTIDRRIRRNRRSTSYRPWQLKSDDLLDI